MSMCMCMHWDENGDPLMEKQLHNTNRKPPGLAFDKQTNRPSASLLMWL